MKKPLGFVLAVLVFVLLCSAASAATITTSGTYDLSTFGNDQEIIINSGLTVTLTGGGITYTNVRINCATGVTLTLDNVRINNSSSSSANGTPLAFVGSGNTLYLSGDNYLAAGVSRAAIFVPDAQVFPPRAMTYLTIDGTGTLEAHGNQGYAAAIGGDYYDTNKAGHITIEGGTIYAYGGWNAAGIGGGHGTGCGTITINGGTIYAYGGYTGPGIGQGDNCSVSDAGTVTINDGTVYAYGGAARPDAGSGGGGAGIGGGTDSACGIITINGGTVTAIGGDANASDATNRGAAGIGGGCRSLAGTVNFNGGVTYASSGTYLVSAPDDIGAGEGSGSTVTVNIAGSAAVIAENDEFTASLNTSTHTHKRYDSVSEPMVFSGGLVYGITADPLWVNAEGGYFILHHLYYNANGGTGTVSSSGDPIHYMTTVSVESGSPLSYSGYVFSGWNTFASGSGTSYAVGSDLVLDQDMMLYAQWSAIPVTGDSSHITLWIFMLSIAGIAAFVLIALRYRHTRSIAQ